VGFEPGLARGSVPKFESHPRHACRGVRTGFWRGVGSEVAPDQASPGSRDPGSRSLFRPKPELVQMGKIPACEVKADRIGQIAEGVTGADEERHGQGMARSPRLPTHQLNSYRHPGGHRPQVILEATPVANRSHPAAALQLRPSAIRKVLQCAT
jgi:hypothetical protein